MSTATPMMQPAPGGMKTIPGIAPDAAASTNLREFLAFKLGNEEYGIDILRVQEIRSYESRPARQCSTVHQGRGEPARRDRPDRRTCD